MTYQETLDYLYEKLPVFQNQGSVALNFKLDNIKNICRELGNPHLKFKSIHVAGTNGKGSTSHILASILMKQGYDVGLYTSPHLKSFTERIKVNGKEISESEVVDFVSEITPLIDKYRPSFFEVTVAMAFWYFSKQSIDYAIVEVGMGGRLDSTNIINPEVAVITNISLDHQQYLGNTIQEIAREKAGVIKRNRPIVIGEVQNDLIPIFKEISTEKGAVLKLNLNNKSLLNRLHTESYQDKNIETALKTIEVLMDNGVEINQEKLIKSVKGFKEIAGLKGRWQALAEKPKIICDTGHNVAGVSEVIKMLAKEEYKQLHFVIGMVEEKEVKEVLELLPSDAKYYFCRAKNVRSKDAKKLAKEAKKVGLTGKVFNTVEEAIVSAKKTARPKDLIFIGGSTFVVAEIPFL